MNICKLRGKEGKIMIFRYKFIVDNRWICTDDDPKVTDIQGNLNNSIHVQ